MTLRLAVAIGAGVLFGSAQAAPPTQCAIATIEVEPGTSGITLTGRALALTDCQFTASMTVERSGQAGHTKTVQGGSFHLNKGQGAKVATVGLSLSAGDSLSVELVLSSQGRQVAMSSLHVGE